MDFWHGPAVLKYQDHAEKVEARIFVDVDFDLKIEVPNNLGFAALFLTGWDDITVTIPCVNNPVPVFLSHLSASSSKVETVILSPKRTPMWKGGSEPLKRGTAALLNFTGFDVGPLSRSRTVLLACGWSLTMTPTHKDLLEYPKLIAGEEHMVTHSLEFERTDGALFSRDEMLSFIEELTQFFSFCHGGWVGTALAVGHDESGLACLEEWGHGRLGPPSRPEGWLDRHHLECLLELYPLYMQRVTDEDWANAFGQVIYWLRRSEIENTGPDGGIILLQAALERFAWHLLVIDRGALSGQGFERLTAADKIRLMLTQLNLPKQVPCGLEALTTYANRNSVDAPEAFTRIRNRLVHPPKVNSKEEHLPYYEVYNLGRWYTELAVLAACGYTGLYSNRTRKTLWVGEVEKVPWAS